MAVWKRVQKPETGFIYSLSESISILDWRYPGLLEATKKGRLMIASDYSGQHKSATHEAYSFLLTSEDEIESWLSIRDAFRRDWLPDGRRLSFKQLREPVRRRALLPFLKAAESIRGNIITFLIDRRIESFCENGPRAFADIFEDCFSPGTKPGTIEKMVRLASFVAMLTAGLRSKDQESIWISDHDETLETFSRREGLGRLTSYLTLGLTGWHNPADMYFTTTASPFAPSWAEDVASIPDIIAGACCQLSSLFPTFLGKERWTRVLSSEMSRDDRARQVGDWLATTNGSLRQILLRLELDDEQNPRTSAQFFSGAIYRTERI